VISKIIKGWCYYESGVRELKRQFEKIARKYAQEIVAAKPGRRVLDNDPEQAEVQCISYDYSMIQKLDLTKDKNLELIQKYLGPPIFDAYSEYRKAKTFPPGQLNILTVSGGMIGHVTVVECCFDNSEWDKKGQITSSGNLKNVLQESLKLAKINAVKYLNEEQIKLIQKSNIHIHFMDGAVPKDGPSAGTAITTALISLASGFSVPSNISMTGEISLNGNVCKIGGVQ
jgi:ATP-dependent Lon protease